MKGHYLRIKTKKDYQSKGQIKENKSMLDLCKPIKRNTRADKRWQKWHEKHNAIVKSQLAREVYRNAEFELAQQGGFTRRIIRRASSRYCFDFVHKQQEINGVFVGDYVVELLDGESNKKNKEVVDFNECNDCNTRSIFSGHGMTFFSSWFAR